MKYKNVQAMILSCVVVWGAAVSVCAVPVVSPEGQALMAKAVAAECGDASLGVQIGLAAVILHRMETVGFPDTAAGVIYSDAFLACTRTGRIALPMTKEKWQLASYAVRCACAGMDPTEGALYFSSEETGALVTDRQLRYGDEGYLFY